MQASPLDMLFVRDFTRFTGGHLKFAAYIGHTMSSGLATPVLYQTPRSRTVPGNIFNPHDGPTIDELKPFPSYFVAGADWLILDEAGIDPGAAPVVNLIQDFRYADPANPLHACLKRPALRICVSEALAEAVRPHAHGEVHVIANGLDSLSTPPPRSLDAPIRVVISGHKDAKLADAIAAQLNGLCEIDLLVSRMPRSAFLQRLADSSICVLLPYQREGFFLPPLEAMALGRAVITPDCLGNRMYCRHDENGLMPAHDADEIAASVLTLMRNNAMLNRLARAGLSTAAGHSIEKERATYCALLSGYFGRSR